MIVVHSCSIFDVLLADSYIYIYITEGMVFHLYELLGYMALQLSVGLAINKGVCEPDVSE